MKKLSKTVSKKNKCKLCKTTDYLAVATYADGSKWLECENCYSVIKPLNDIAYDTYKD